MHCQLFHIAYPSPLLPAASGRTLSLLILGTEDIEKFSSLSETSSFLYNCNIHCKCTTAMEHLVWYLPSAFQVLALFSGWDLTSTWHLKAEKGQSNTVHHGCINMTQHWHLEPLSCSKITSVHSKQPLKKTPQPSNLTADSKFSCLFMYMLHVLLWSLLPGPCSTGNTKPHWLCITASGRQLPPPPPWMFRSHLCVLVTFHTIQYILVTVYTFFHLVKLSQPKQGQK